MSDCPKKLFGCDLHTRFRAFFLRDFEDLFPKGEEDCIFINNVIHSPEEQKQAIIDRYEKNPYHHKLEPHEKYVINQKLRYLESIVKEDKPKIWNDYREKMKAYLLAQIQGFGDNTFSDLLQQVLSHQNLRKQSNGLQIKAINQQNGDDLLQANPDYIRVIHLLKTLREENEKRNGKAGDIAAFHNLKFVLSVIASAEELLKKYFKQPAFQDDLNPVKWKYHKYEDGARYFGAYRAGKFDGAAIKYKYAKWFVMVFNYGDDGPTGDYFTIDESATLKYFSKKENEWIKVGPDDWKISSPRVPSVPKTTLQCDRNIANINQRRSVPKESDGKYKNPFGEEMFEKMKAKLASKK